MWFAPDYPILSSSRILTLLNSLFKKWEFKIFFTSINSLIAQETYSASHREIQPYQLFKDHCI